MAQYMDTDFSQIQDLVIRPGESLAVEIKRWLNPESPEGMAKLVRGCLAIRNNGGGFFVLGFDDKTLEPEDSGRPDAVNETFHGDKIQSLISRFSSEPFDVDVYYPERDEKLFVVIAIPSGVRTPVACKSDLIEQGNKLLSRDDVYCRTLRSNNTPSTSKASWKDWGAIMDVCFENREADIGRFVRRHITGLNQETLEALADALGKAARTEPGGEEIALEFMDASLARFNTVVEERKVTLPEHGYWEVGLVIVGNVPAFSANLDFLNLLNSSNPYLTGWSVWLISRSFPESDFHPYVLDGIWEEALFSIVSGWNDYADFMRFDPSGKFYIRRPFKDDIGGSDRSPEPMTALNIERVVSISAEALAVGLAFAKAMGCSSENCFLQYCFRWSKLSGRSLSSWADFRRLSSSREAYQDQVISSVAVALDTPPSSLSGVVAEATAPLFEVFNGFSLSPKVFEDMTERLLNRKL